MRCCKNRKRNEVKSIRNDETRSRHFRPCSVFLLQWGFVIGGGCMSPWGFVIGGGCMSPWGIVIGGGCMSQWGFVIGGVVCRRGVLS